MCPILKEGKKQMAETKQKIDLRTFNRYVEKGILKDSDLQAHLKSLPDDAENAVWVDLTVEDAEVEETDDLEVSEEEGLEGDLNASPAGHAQSPEEAT